MKTITREWYGCNSKNGLCYFICEKMFFCVWRSKHILLRFSENYQITNWSRIIRELKIYKNMVSLWRGYWKEVGSRAELRGTLAHACRRVSIFWPRTYLGTCTYYRVIYTMPAHSACRYVSFHDWNEYDGTNRKL